MPATHHYEQQFLDALKDIFVGAKVEGESGYINLMKIKSRYFAEGVLPRLQQDLDAACKPFEPSFREELFDKLYDFFKRYFSESGSIYFRHTPLHNNVYEKVYTDDRDVMLFWKTHMLYYVKTDRLFNSMDVDVDGTAFFFDASAMEHKRANEKRELMYAFSKRERDGKLVFTVTYSERGRKTKTDDILRQVRETLEVLETSRVLDEETLQKAFRVFEKQSEVDYFINKNAKAFLKEQFDLWLYQYVFAGESAWTETRLRQLQAIKDIAYKIIDFIAQFEDELVRVWNKPKFVLNSHYVITLDKITDAKLRKKIFAHKGMQAQKQEWKELGMVDDKETFRVLENPKGLPARYQFLPLDTRHFPDLELDILALFDDLDAALDGWLIHSENYQALVTLVRKFEGRVQAIYIDPPYNTSDESFIYSNNYKHSSWITMMENRIVVAKQLLAPEGVMEIAIDDTESPRLRLLLDGLFDSSNRVATIAIEVNPAGQNIRPNVPALSHDYCHVYANDIDDVEMMLRDLTEDEIALYSEKDDKGNYLWDNLRRRGGNSRPKDRPNQWFPLYADVSRKKVSLQPFQGAKEIWPIDPQGEKRIWRANPDGARRWIASGDISVIQKVGRVEIVKKSRMPVGKKPKTLWKDSIYSATSYGTKLLGDIVKNAEFTYPKSLLLVRDCIKHWADQSALVLDFFAGSGTTAHAVINLNRADGGKRKYILVEMGEHFNTVILPRVKKVVFSDKWKDGKAQEGKGISHFCKYYELEQYEDALRRASYQDAPLLQGVDPYTSYVFLRDLKMLDAVSLDKEKNRVDVHPEKLYDGIDLAETLSCVTGKWIKRITRDAVTFEDGTTASLTNPDWTLIKPLVWW